MNISGPAAVAKPEMLFYAPGDLTVTQLLSETTKDCDNIVITVLCVSVTKEIPSP